MLFKIRPVTAKSQFNTGFFTNILAKNNSKAFYLTKSFSKINENNCMTIKKKSKNFNGSVFLNHQKSTYSGFKIEKSNSLLFKISKKFTTDNANNNKSEASQESLDQQNKEQLIKHLDKEFEKLLESSEASEVEKRIKFLSIKLLQANSSKEIISLYEDKYLKNLIDITADEIILFLYFYTSFLDRETNYDSSTNTLHSKAIFNIINNTNLDCLFLIYKNS